MAFHWCDNNLHTTVFTPRDFQVELLAAAYERNTIICLGHRSSKEFIALKLLQELSRRGRRHGKVSVYLSCEVGKDKEPAAIYTMLTHLTDLRVWQEQPDMQVPFAHCWTDYHVSILRPEGLLCLLESRELPLSSIELIVLEDCHDSAVYQRILPIFEEHILPAVPSDRPRVLGLAGPLHSAGCELQQLSAMLVTLEQNVLCRIETASDIVTVLRYCSKPHEYIVQCAPFEMDELSLVLADILNTHKSFLVDHRYDPFEIYGMDQFMEDLKDIPDPKLDPLYVIDSLLVVLHEMGPWCTQRAAHHFYQSNEKLKVKTPHERHYLLYCLVSTALVQLHSLCDHTFQKQQGAGDPRQTIERYSSPKVKRLLQTLRCFKPEDSHGHGQADGLRKIRHQVEHADFNKLSHALETKCQVVDQLETQATDTRSLVANLEHILQHPEGKPFPKRNSHRPPPPTTTQAHSSPAKGKHGANSHNRVRRRVYTRRHNRDQHDGGDTLCALIYCNQNHTARVLFELLAEMGKRDADLKFLRCQYTTDRVADPATEPKEAELEHRRQEEVLKRFRMHDCNVLIGTSVLEEGIDVPKCNLVVRWDPPTTYRSYVQCKGRARAAPAYHVILVAPRYVSPVIGEVQLTDKSHRFVCGPAGDSAEVDSDSDDSAMPNSLGSDPYTFGTARGTVKILNPEVFSSVPPTACEIKEIQDETPAIALDSSNSSDEAVSLNNTPPSESQSSGERKPRKRFQCEVPAPKENDDQTEAHAAMEDGLASTTKALVHQMAQYREIEQMLLSKCANTEPPEQEQQEAERFNSCLAAYRPKPQLLTGASVDLGTAIALVNKYCARLPSDTFTKLTALWRCTRSERAGVTLYQYTLRLPINSPLKHDIVGLPLPTQTLARRLAALQACVELHKIGELDDQLQPIGKEGFRALEADWECFELEPEDEQIVQLSDEPRPGTTKRRQYYYKRIASEFCDCRPVAGAPCYLYFIKLTLQCPIPEEQNTRGRKIYPPEDAQQGFGILTMKRIPKLSAFSIFTRSGEVKVSLELAKERVVLTPEQIGCINGFLNYTFTNVLRLQKFLMLFDPDSTENCVFIVPTLKTGSPQGSKQIDWKFLELIQANGNTMPKSVPDEERLAQPFDAQRFQDAVVMPWYRNQDQPQYFYVAEICPHLSPLSCFPGDNYRTFKHYYFVKYGLTIQNAAQPLLDVDHTSARLNFLTPRYVNRKGVALPTSSEETKRAKRENLEQKQILVPELCTVHPFPASLWRTAVCLPCILYRINGLLLADDIRKQVSADLGLGRQQIDQEEQFEWPMLDFGWSLSEVLKKSRESKQKDSAVTNGKAQVTKAESEPLPVASEAATVEEKAAAKSANELIIEGEQKLQEADEDFIEIGTWSNDMADDIASFDDEDEDEEDEESYLPVLPANVKFCDEQTRYGSPTFWDVSNADGSLKQPKSKSNQQQHHQQQQHHLQSSTASLTAAGLGTVSSSVTASATSKTMSSSTLTTLVKIEAPSPKVSDLEKSNGSTSNSVPIGIAVARKRPQEALVSALTNPATLPLQQPLSKDMNCFGIRVADLSATSCGNLYFTGNGDLMTTGTATAEDLNRTPSTFWQYPNALPIESVISMSPATVGLQYTREANRGQVVLLPAAPAALAGISNFPLLTSTDPFQQAAAAAAATAFVWPSYIPQATAGGSSAAAAAAAAAALQPPPNLFFNSMGMGMGGHSTLGPTPSYASTLQLYLAAAANASGSSTLCQHSSNQQTSSTTTTNSTINLSLAAAVAASAGVTSSTSSLSSSSSSRFLSLAAAAAQSAPIGSLLLPPHGMKLEDYSTHHPMPLALPPLVPLEATSSMRDKEQALNLMRLPTPPTSATMDGAAAAMVPGMGMGTGHPMHHQMFQSLPSHSASATPALLNLSMHGAASDLSAAGTPMTGAHPCDEAAAAAAALNFKLHAPLTPQTPPRLPEIPVSLLPQMQDVNIQTDTPVCSEDESLSYPCPGPPLTRTGQEPMTEEALSISLVQPLELTKTSEVPNECHTHTQPQTQTQTHTQTQIQTNPVSSDIQPSASHESAEQMPNRTPPPAMDTPQTAPEDLTGLELLSNISTNSTPFVRVKQEPMEHIEHTAHPVAPPPPMQPMQQQQQPMMDLEATPQEPLGGLKLLCALAEQRIQEEVVQGSSLFATPYSRTPSPTPTPPASAPGSPTPMPTPTQPVGGNEGKSCFGFVPPAGGSLFSSTSSFQMPLSSPAFPSMQGIELPTTSLQSADPTPPKRKKHKHSKSSSSESRKSARCSKKSKKKHRRDNSSRQQQFEPQLQSPLDYGEGDASLQDEQLQSELRSALHTMGPSYAQRFGNEVFSIMDSSMRMRLADITRQYRKKKRKLDEITKLKKKRKSLKLQHQQQQQQLQQLQQPVQAAQPALSPLQQPQLTLSSTLSSVLGTSSPLRDYKFPKFSSSNLQASSFLRFPEKTTHSFPPPPPPQQPQTEPSPLPHSGSPITSSFVRLEPSALDAAVAPSAPIATSISSSNCSSPSTAAHKQSSTSASLARRKRKLKASPGSGDQPTAPTEAKRRASATDKELQLTSEHLYREETRVLTDMGGLFYAGVMKPLRPPDVYAITLDGERGNKSHVMSREDILKDTILEVAPKSVECVPVGTRLCAYWSQQYRCLYPGRAIESEPAEEGAVATAAAAPSTPTLAPDFVSVEFDDGDSGRIRLQNIRLLLSDYPIAEYNDNPLYSVGKQKRGALRTGESGGRCTSQEPLHTQHPAHMSGCEDSHSHHSAVLNSDNTTSLAATMELFTQRSEKKRLKKSLKKMSRSQNASGGGVGNNSLSVAAVSNEVADHASAGDAGAGAVDEAAGRKHHKHKKRKKHKKHHRKNGSEEPEQHQDFITTAEEVTEATPAPASNRVKMEVKVKTEQLDMEEESASNLMSEISDEAKGEDLVEHNNSKGSSKIAAFLPERQLWGWNGVAYRKGGVKGRARKQFYKTIKRGKETITVGDSAVFLSTGRPDRPYIGRIESMWETSTGNKVVRVAWFYHPEETTGCPKLKYPGALFESSHDDENDVQTISHRCEVLQFGHYFEKFGADSKQYQSIYDNNDTYYLAGHYNPRLQVLKLQDDIPTLEELQDTNTTTTTTTNKTTTTTTNEN
ncbi:uncharacterized protein LOC117897508 isoform X1 [Drosophila subobscura]|uniref:uncharacterized protein LOC117897508 isoform X1 n=1 Tax=Drosophila subobscura TaxID=7241 RepID=UPI00155A54BC|nr:uncharacterized protein LOC117897508 isoform X1 [Drosophila subobscura]